MTNNDRKYVSSRSVLVCIHSWMRYFSFSGYFYLNGLLSFCVSVWTWRFWTKGFSLLYIYTRHLVRQLISWETCFLSNLSTLFKVLVLTKGKESKISFSSWEFKRRLCTEFISIFRIHKFHKYNLTDKCWEKVDRKYKHFCMKFFQKQF